MLGCVPAVEVRFLVITYPDQEVIALITRLNASRCGLRFKLVLAKKICK